MLPSSSVNNSILEHHYSKTHSIFASALPCYPKSASLPEVEPFCCLPAMTNGMLHSAGAQL